MRATPRKSGQEAAAGSRFLSEVVADNVHVLRAQRRFSQTDVAEKMAKLGHGWSRATVSDVERSGRNVTLDEALALCLVLGVTVPQLLDPTGIDGRTRTGLDIGAALPLNAEVARMLVRGDVVVRASDPGAVAVNATASGSRRPSGPGSLTRLRTPAML